MTNFFESELFEPIDLCSCFEPIFDPPPEQVSVWNFSEPEPTLENTSSSLWLFSSLLRCNPSLLRGSFYFNSQFLQITGMLFLCH